MSDDFLSRFSKDRYNPDDAPIPKKSDTEETQVEADTVPTAPKEKKEREIPPPTPSRVTSKHVEHETDVDLEYQKKRKRNRIIAIASTAAIIVVAIGIYIWMQFVPIIALENKNLSEAKSWASSNGIELVVNYEYSATHDENTVISQDIEPDKSVWKGTTLTLAVSKGADQEEVLKLPDIGKMSLDQLQSWASENKFDNLKVTKVFHEEIPNNKVIDFSFDEDVTAESFKRKDTLKVNVSKGKEVFEKTIEVPDFKDKTKAEVEAWQKEKETTVTYEEAASNDVEKGFVISQSVAAKEKVSKKDPVTVVISTGKVIEVPNFANYTFETAATQSMDLMINVQELYHDGVPYGHLISQSVPAGSQVTMDNNKVDVYYSKGLPYIDLSGQTEGTLPAYFFDFQSKGANITYTVSYVAIPPNTPPPSSTGEDEDGSAMMGGIQKGTIKYADYDRQFVGLNEVIHIEIYR